ncbi:MAG: RNA polymerase-binding protein DksA [Deltaproteobacteria bacterium RIFCSPLOWO2_12_FULL_44_12]|nr:MAG: RNA polymerase-binding protein DksA [Deltaproteobacteria bacterium RIFCSPHIGHO2_01_FULL_43_49]OGQ16502.1 MAG: RNA polymerase-binding protein DksA [Deltaproteobacteria bacterium RIFCSPHIGHO2_02_FULL_44_53]OGQ27746.1 MAG: RNA polymerase-binding protein DksA [Deltaproteobacteria bacterium RIFCSPHIGHO2_12_FULL_44_21]OGQ33019.1 MAG: RNA polymerase-binding protein DksA [Deltaproteobacteria bacterium RIFCSPLOWO2_01_FULL_45_74]OGQ42120.1 MAG: RNA polymerase-binding protein DksA [Deltaproteobact
MNKKEITRFKKLLEERKQALLNIINNTKEQGLGFNSEDLPDEIDLASSEADQSMNLRLRDRERVLLKKIERTLEKMDEGIFGVCETCGEEISAKRLEARPVTDLCIRCKEEQERVEKGYAD